VNDVQSFRISTAWRLKRFFNRLITEQLMASGNLCPNKAILRQLVDGELNAARGDELARGSPAVIARKESVCSPGIGNASPGDHGRTPAESFIDD
jgi:hypothetical protein